MEGNGGEEMKMRMSGREEKRGKLQMKAGRREEGRMGDENGGGGWERKMEVEGWEEKR